MSLICVVFSGYNWDKCLIILLIEGFVFFVCKYNKLGVFCCSCLNLLKLVSLVIFCVLRKIGIWFFCLDVNLILNCVLIVLMDWFVCVFSISIKFLLEFFLIWKEFLKCLLCFLVLGSCKLKCLIFFLIFVIKFLK